jgi:hypothetical protein
LLEVLGQGWVLAQPGEIIEMSVLCHLERRVLRRCWELIVVPTEILRSIGGAVVADVKAMLVVLRKLSRFY